MSKRSEKLIANANRPTPAYTLLHTPSWLAHAIAALRKLRHDAPFKPSAVVGRAGFTRKRLRQFAPDKYALCPCGSAHKFKWCCWEKEYESI